MDPIQNKLTNKIKNSSQKKEKYDITKMQVESAKESQKENISENNKSNKISNNNNINKISKESEKKSSFSMGSKAENQKLIWEASEKGSQHTKSIKKEKKKLWIFI